MPPIVSEHKLHSRRNENCSPLEIDPGLHAYKPTTIITKLFSVDT